MLTNSKSIRILVFGDSYVFGKIPGGMRYDSATRFTGVMQSKLGKGFDVIEEGLRGRCLAGPNLLLPERDGLIQFGPIFGSHLPLDLVVFMLGTNDTNRGGTLAPNEIVTYYQLYLDKIAWWCDHLGGYSVPQVLFVAPPIVNEHESKSAFGDWFDGAESKSRELPEHIKQFAHNHNLHFFDASTLVTPSPLDGIHLSAKDNHKLGDNLAIKIKMILQTI